jgi:hypothetical protein
MGTPLEQGNLSPSAGVSKPFGNVPLLKLPQGFRPEQGSEMSAERRLLLHSVLRLQSLRDQHEQRIAGLATGEQTP